MRKQAFSILTIVAILALALVAPLYINAPATAAPVAAPTPVAGVINQGLATDPQFFIFSNPVTITTDTRTCLDASRYDVLDLEYAVNQSSINTMTVKLQYTNRGQRWVDGATILNANTTDTNGLVQYPVFGRLTCVFFDVANSNGVSVTVNAIGK